MRLLETFDEATLLDTLVEYTARYRKLQNEGGREKDIVNCRQTIHALINELEIRRNNRYNSNSPEQY